MGSRVFSKSDKIPYEEAQDFIQKYFDVFKGVASYMEHTKKKAYDVGYVDYE